MNRPTSDAAGTGHDGPDAHLHTALRHAPDAELQAPAALGERIRAAAHAAVRPAPWWQRWRAQPPWRLGTSGAFATVALAGVIGLLWQGEPPPVQAPEPVAVPTAAPEPTPATAAAPAEAATKSAVPAPTMPAPLPPVARSDRDRAPATAERAPAPAAPAARAAQVAAAAPAEPVAPAVPPTPAATTATPEPAAADAATAKAPPNAVPAAAPAPPAPPPVAAMSAPPERARALGLAPAPASAWLLDLERSVAGAWRAEPGEPPPLRRLGTVGIAFDGDRVWRCDGEAPRVCRSAPLQAPAAQRLREALDALR